MVFKLCRRSGPGPAAGDGRPAGGRTSQASEPSNPHSAGERDPYAAELEEYFLRTEGYDVRVALSAAEAERLLTEQSPKSLWWIC